MQVGQECNFPVDAYEDELTGRQVRRVVFASDRDGFPAVYVTEI